MHHQIEDAGLGNLRIVDLDLVGLREQERRPRHQEGDQSGATSKSISFSHAISARNYIPCENRHNPRPRR